MRFLLDKPWLVLVAVCIALFIAAELGYRLATFTRINDDTHHHEHIAGLREGLFILLGLLLGFAIAMILPRFDLRSELVVDEASAISKTMLGADLLPGPLRNRTIELLHQYVLLRRDFAAQTLLDLPALDRQTQSTRALQRQLWEQIVAFEKERDIVIVETYLKPLSAMIEIAEKRMAAFENRIPLTLWFIVFLVAAFQSFTTGFSLKRRFWFSLLMTPLVIAVVMALLADLDSPNTGWIRVRQNSMDRLVLDATGSRP